MRATILMVTILSMLMVAPVFIHVQYGEAAPGDLLFTIPNPTPVNADNFGWSVATTPTGDLLVAAVQDDTGGDDAGVAYLFNGATGALLLTILNPTPDAADSFGFSVATTPTGDLLVEARRDDTGATNTGAAYLIEGISVAPPDIPSDLDDDGISDTTDNCPDNANPEQTDSDGDGVGDACNDADDADGDEIADSLDNCPTTANPGQEDSDGDGEGDTCDLEDILGRIQQLEAQVEELLNQGSDHTHPYLTGKGKGHNNTEAETGSAIPLP